MEIRNTIFVILFLSLFSCKSEKTEFEKGLIFIESLYDSNRKDDFKKNRISESNILQHEGTKFKNEYLNTEQGKLLIIFFESRDIKEQKDVIKIMLTSLHRKLNLEEIDLNRQIDYIVVPRKIRKECEEKRELKAINYYNKYIRGDSLNIYYSISEFDRRAVFHICPDIDWIFDRNKDLMLTASIIKKYIVKDTLRGDIPLLRHYFDIKVSKMSDWNMNILSNKVNKGDTINLDLYYATINDSIGR